MGVLWAPAAAQVTDGDSLKQGGKTYRLWGIDAPELAQTCADGWPAGKLAATKGRGTRRCSWRHCRAPSGMPG